ncbi:hypothetical protein ACYSNR_15245 [Enterococcus sp. LJL128]
MLYIYLIMVRRSIVVFAKRSIIPSAIGLCLGAVFLFFGLTAPQTLNDKLQDIMTSCLLFSFMLDCRGLADGKIINNSFDNRGVYYSELEKVVLSVKNQEIRMNYFRNGRRGPLLIFKMPLETMLAFLSDRVAKDLDIDIIIED